MEKKFCLLNSRLPSVLLFCTSVWLSYLRFFFHYSNSSHRFAHGMRKFLLWSCNFSLADRHVQKPARAFSFHFICLRKKKIKKAWHKSVTCIKNARCCSEERANSKCTKRKRTKNEEKKSNVFLDTHIKTINMKHYRHKQVINFLRKY